MMVDWLSVDVTPYMHACANEFSYLLLLTLIIASTSCLNSDDMSKTVNTVIFA